MILALSIVIFSCTSLEKSTQTEKPTQQEIYIFDDVEKIDSVKTEIQGESIQQPAKSDTIQNSIEEKKLDSIKIVTATQKFIIQLGAFSTKERAEKYISENRLMISYEMKYFYKETTKYWIVHLPPFITRSEAEVVKNTLQKIPTFKDIFILTELQ
jgi:cell division septation protein DedD